MLETELRNGMNVSSDERIEKKQQQRTDFFSSLSLSFLFVFYQIQVLYMGVGCLT